MVSRMHPEDVELLGYVEGDLDDAARAQIEAHVAGCAECAEQIRFLEAGRDALRASPLLEAPEHVVPSLPARAPARRWRARSVVAVLAPVAVVALVIGVIATTDPGDGGGGEEAAATALTAAQEGAEGGGAETAPGAAPTDEAAVRSVAGPPEEVVRLLRAIGLDARREGSTVVVSGATSEQVERALADRSPGVVRVVIGE